MPLPVLLLLLFALAGSSLPAQSVGPDVYHKKAVAAKAKLELAPPSVMAGVAEPLRIELSALSDSDLRRDDSAFGPEQVGLHRKLPVVSATTAGGATGTTPAGLATTAQPPAAETLPPGGWTVLPGGKRVWRMAIHSPGAAGMRVHFEGFDVGDGRVWIYAPPDGGAIATASQQGRGPNGDGDFWSDVVFSDTAIVEFEPGPSALSGEKVPFRIAEISHLWQAIGSSPGLFDARLRAEGATPAQAAPCSLDVTCYPEWTDTSHAVARILFETSGGSALCSGTLLNDIGDANRLYFLTAAHCIHDDAAARSLIAFWNYQTSTCNGAPPSENAVPRTLGSTLLATKGGTGAPDPKGDFTLLLLNDAPDNALLSGWDANPVGTGIDTTGIHHPRGDYKRITFGRSVQDFSVPDQYLSVAEFEGRTQNGSSGSGVFTAPGVLVGALSFGPKAPPGETECDFNPGGAGYMRLSRAYADLQPFLENNSTPPPAEADPPGGDLSLGGTDTFTLDAVDGPTLFSGDFAYAVDVTSDVTRIRIALQTLDPSNADLDLYVRRGDAPLVSDSGDVLTDYSSTSDTGSEEIVIDATSSPALTAGTYYIAFASFTTGTPIVASIQVTIERGSGPSTPTGVALSSGQPVDFALPAVDTATLFTGPSVYTVNVPDGADRLDVSTVTATQNADVDLYVRFGQPPEVQGGQVVADASSESFTGDELVSLTRADGLRTGTYYVALSLFSTGISVRGTLEADVGSDSGGNQTGIPVSQGSPQTFNVGPVDGPTFFTDTIYRVDVGAATARLTVDLETTTPGVDVDLYVRYGQPPELSGGQVISTFSSETLTGREQVVVSAASSPPLQAGSYYIALVLYSTGQAASGQVRVTLEGATAGGPQVNAATNAASFAQGPIAPGQIISLFGAAMGPAVGLGAQLDPLTGRLATTLGGVSVLFDSVPAPLFFVRGDQINVQVPYGIAGRPSTTIAVIVNGSISNALNVPVSASAPGLFLLGDGTSEVVAQREDGSVVSASNPARRGEVIILYATGEGLTKPPARSGGLAPGDEPLQMPILPVEMHFGDVVVGNLFFAGSSPGFAGLMQINVRIPDNSPTGAAVPLQVFVGPNASLAGATIAVQ